MNKVRVFICEQPMDIDREINKYCENTHHEPVDISVTFDSRYKVYTIAIIVRE